MNAPRDFRVSGRFGLAVLVAWPMLVIGLSAIGERVALIHTVTLLGILPVLLGAVAWLRAGHHHPKIFFQKRCITAASLVVALSVPLTHWPLALSFLAAHPAMERLAEKTTQQLTTFSFKENGYVPVQVNINPPVRCGLLKIETVGLDWVYPVAGCLIGDNETPQSPVLKASQLWVNRDGDGPTFFTDPGCISEKLRMSFRFVANTPTPRLMLRH